MWKDNAPSKQITELPTEQRSLFVRVLMLADTHQKVTQSIIQEGLIGLGLIAVGVVTWVLVWMLPAKPMKWLFYVAGGVFVVAGALRIDRTTRPYRTYLSDKRKARRIIR